MDLSIIGSGYVGTTVAACFADLGHDVTAIDVDQSVVETLNAGEAPIEEPRLPELIAEHAGDSLRATTDYDAIRKTDATFLALPTPSNKDGSIDLQFMKAGAEGVGEALSPKDGYHTVIVKSTVVPGTTEDVLAPIIEETADRSQGDQLGIAMNPEFLREGTAVADFLNPDKLVFGSDHPQAIDDLHGVFAPLLERHDAPVVETGAREAEMIKYANNAFLASKVSLINDLGNICKELGVDAYEVADAIGLDDRISAKFLRSGLGWGGSCWPKDISAITHVAKQHDYDPPILEAAVAVNDLQPRRFLRLMDQHVTVDDEPVAVLGLSFKPGTDDIRNARSIEVIDGLQSRNAEVVAYDPVASANMLEIFPDIEYADSPADALEGAVAALIVTEWDEISGLDEEFDAMAEPVVIDGRRAIDRREGLVYEGLTW